MNLEKRTWCYIQKPHVYEVASCSCGNDNNQWSEYKGYIWCPVCKKDFIPEHNGIFDGPIAIQTADILGVKFDKFDIVNNRIIKFNVETRMYENEVITEGIPETKPTKFEVIRYYRPKAFYGRYFEDGMDIISDRGTTVIYSLDYEKNEFIANWSICNSDNFNKKTGVTFARDCKTPIKGILNKNNGYALYDVLLQRIANIESQYIDARMKSNAEEKSIDFEYSDLDIRNFKKLKLEIIGHLQ